MPAIDSINSDDARRSSQEGRGKRLGAMHRGARAVRFHFVSNDMTIGWSLHPSVQSVSASFPTRLLTL